MKRKRLARKIIGILKESEAVRENWEICYKHGMDYGAGVLSAEGPEALG